MNARWMLVLLAGCGRTPTRPVDPPGPPPSAEVAAVAPTPATVCFGDDAGPLVPDDSIAAFVDDDGVHIGSYWFCDLPDRVVLVENEDAPGRFTGEVISLPRADPSARSRAKLSARSSCNDECGPDGVGHAGCSELETCTLYSKLPGASRIETLYPTPRALDALDTIDGDTCAPTPDEDMMAACATTSRTVAFSMARCEGGGSEMMATVYDDATVSSDQVFTGGLPTVDGTTWTYHFREPELTLTFRLGASPSATLTFEGTTEDCFAFAID